MLLGKWMEASQKEREVYKLISDLSTTFGENHKILDAVYDPQTIISKEKFSEMLIESGFQIDWNGKLPETKNETKEEKDEQDAQSTV